nr:hypothetical protein [Rhodococcus sp. ZPP]
MITAKAGAQPIIAVDLNTERLQLARELGATDTIVGGTGELTSQIRAIAPARVCYGLDTTGLPSISDTLAARSPSRDPRHGRRSARRPRHRAACPDRWPHPHRHIGRRLQPAHFYPDAGARIEAGGLPTH